MKENEYSEIPLKEQANVSLEKNLDIIDAGLTYRKTVHEINNKDISEEVKKVLLNEAENAYNLKLAEIEGKYTENNPKTR